MRKRATFQQVQKVITRTVVLEKTAEVKLVLAIINQAVMDAMTKCRESRAARSWLFGNPIFEKYCGLIGLNPVYVRELLQKHHFEHVESAARLARINGNAELVEMLERSL